MSTFSTQVAFSGLPDLTRAQSYAECLRYTQYCLRSLAYSELKPFTQQHGLTYAATVTLKNDNLKRQEPHLVQRVLNAFGFMTTLIRVNIAGQMVPHYVFATLEEKEHLRQQLAAFDRLANVPHAPANHFA